MLYIGMAAFCASLVTMIVHISTGRLSQVGAHTAVVRSLSISISYIKLDSQLWFIGSVIALIVSTAIINNFKDKRHYVLNTALMEYPHVGVVA